MNDHYRNCIEACLQCATACNHCAASCTRENHIQQLADCILLDMECADICIATAQLMSMNSHYVKEICKICADVCERCASACEKHQHDHCIACAAACRKCAEACREMLVEN